MLEKILIARRGDLLPQGSVATQPIHFMAESRIRYYTAETSHV
ncbi:MAG: hypothetical protein ABIS30_10550 [Gallionella sp.]|jgi:hypothetical protein